MATLREVARRAGVSVATASRVASGSGAVSSETRERVERAMRELLYIPRRDESPKRGIGLLLPELSNPIFPRLAQAMESRATARGLASILCHTGGSPARELGYVHMLLERRVEGMIFISCELANSAADHAHYRWLLDEGARLVFVNGASGEIEAPAVGVDERAAGRIATQHLIDLGHRRIGFVGGPEHYTPTHDKEAGRQAALRQAGLDPSADLVAHAEFSLQGGRAAARALLARNGDRPTGVICSSDLMAIGVLIEAASVGLCVPDDLSVVGFDGIEPGDWTHPPLTTVEQPIAAIANAAVDAIAGLVGDLDKAYAQLLFRPVLRIRSSTGPPPAALAHPHAIPTT